MTDRIRVAETDDEIEACFAVMSELRPHLDRATFVSRVRSQERQGGYRIACRLRDEQVVAAAGFRILENLAWGQFLYVDDLVTLAEARSQGHGAALLEWLEKHALANACGQLHLDSGVQRIDAHRFYDREDFARTSLHFARRLGDSAGH